MRPEVLYISRNNVQYSTPGTSLFSFSFIGFPYLVLVYKDSISPSSVSFRTGIQAQVVEKFLKKALDIYPIRSYLSLGHGYSNDANDTYRGVPHMGYCKRSAPPVLRINQELADVYWFRVKEDNDDGKKN